MMQKIRELKMNSKHFGGINIINEKEIFWVKKKRLFRKFSHYFTEVTKLLFTYDLLFFIWKLILVLFYSRSTLVKI